MHSPRVRKLARTSTPRNERLAQTLAETGQLAAALAETEDALSRRTGELARTRRAVYAEGGDGRCP